MSKVRKFIDKYFASYLSECRVWNPFFESENNTCFPPTSEELEEIIFYLSSNDLVPVIIGSVAVIKYLNITRKDVRAGDFRLTNKLELFVSGNLPSPLSCWQFKERFKGRCSWISPIGSVIDFFNKKNVLFGDSGARFSIGIDSESASQGCPVADVATLFIIKLNNFKIRDLQDLLYLALKTGIPKNLDKLLSNSRQRKNLTFIRKWIENKSSVKH